MFVSLENRLQSLISRTQKVRQQTEYICDPLKPEDCVVQPVVDVSPPKWHMGHTSWFFEAFVLQPYKKDYPLFHPKYAYLFNSYYEGAGERVERSYRGNMTRPSVAEILEYRRHVTHHLLEYLGDHSPKSKEVLDIVELGLQHEQQHQELLLYDIKYILGHNPLFPLYREIEAINQTTGSLKEQYLEIDQGVYEIGYEGDGFHFDNEKGHHKVYLEPYRIQDRLITHGEFREFVEADGYKDYRHWLMEGWNWVNQHQIDTPFYWFKIDEEWYHFTLGG